MNWSELFTYINKGIDTTKYPNLKFEYTYQDYKNNLKKDDLDIYKGYRGYKDFAKIIDLYIDYLDGTLLLHIIPHYQDSNENFENLLKLLTNHIYEISNRKIEKPSFNDDLSIFYLLLDSDKISSSNFIKLISHDKFKKIDFTEIFILALKKQQFDILLHLCKTYNEFRCFINDFFTQIRNCKKKDLNCIQQVIDNLFYHTLFNQIPTKYYCYNLLFKIGIKDINRRDTNGKTALFYMYSNFGNIKLLLENGSDPNIPDMLGRTPLIEYSSDRSASNIVELLLQYKADPNLIYNNNISALEQAFITNNFKTILLLINYGANVNFQRNDNSTMLNLAASQGYDTIILQLLLDKGANIDNQDNQGNSPLLNAIKSKHLHTAIFLVNAGANVSLYDEFNATPLLRLSSFYKSNIDDYYTLAKLLIKKGANVNSQTLTGETPLYYASRLHEYELAKLLFDNGANPYLKGKNSNSPFEITMDRNYTKLIDLFKQYKQK
jgi:ankyrin repeat protein